VFFYGQCSELCGVNHGFMPIVINAIDPTLFRILMDYKTYINSTATLSDIYSALDISEKN